MAQLIVRGIEHEVVNQLKLQAKAHGISTEEEHRRILRKALVGAAHDLLSFHEALLRRPNVGRDEDFERRQ
jgi:antitoxin FitA